MKYEDSKGKFEHDYWGASYKELVSKIEKKYSKEEIKNFKFTNCSGDGILLYYLTRKLGKKMIYRSEKEHEATHVVIINRATLDIFNPKVYPKIKHLVNDQGTMLLRDMEEVVRFPGVKTVCPNQYPGNDEVIVSRNGVPLSIFRKLDK